jgi:RNA polymerase sigma-32 factor
MQLERDDWQDSNTGNLHAALGRLDERSRVIVEARWLADNKATLHELAARFDVSAERIRQLEKNAIGKLKKAMVA